MQSQQHELSSTIHRPPPRTTEPPAAASQEPADRLNEEFRQEALPHMDAIYRFALRLSADESRAEDLLQETFLKAYKSWHQYTVGTNCRSWLFTICRNLHVRAEEQKSRHRRLLQEKASTDEQNPARSRSPLAPSPPPTPEGVFFDPRIDEVLLQKINELPREYREAVILSDIEDLSYKEMARILDVPVGTVRSRLSRGRKMLRSEFREYAVEHGYLRGDQL